MFGLVSNNRILAKLEQSLIARAINDRGISDKIFELIVGADIGDLWYVFGFNKIFGLLFF